MSHGGLMNVNTWTNHWHTKYTYPLVARISNLLGIPRPLSPRKPHDEIMHVNEESLWSLRHGLRKANFVIRKSWCEHDSSFSWSPRLFAYWLVHRGPCLRLFFADHLWVIARKDGQR